MPTKEEILRWSSRGAKSSPRQAQPQAAPASPPQLPPPPPGQGYAWSQVHGWVLVQVGPTEPYQAPAGARAAVPNAATGYGLPPGGNIIQIQPVKSCKLVRGGVDRFGTPVDPYAEFLAGQRDLDPAQLEGRVPFNVGGLVPSEQDQATLAHIHSVSAVDPQTTPHEDPALDAYGPNGARAARSAPYLVGGGGGGSGG